MTRVMVRYKVKPDRVAENEELIRAVYAELDRDRPEGLGYATFRLDDGVSFVHVASIEDEGGTLLTDVDAFRRFRTDLNERCEEPPVRAELSEVGSFRLFA